VTSGMRQVDYYLSNDLCEPARAERAYSERLIRSPSLLTWQRRPSALRKKRTREDFGVAEHEHFYLCPHKITKFHPDFDGLLGEILRHDRRGILVIPKDPYGYATRKLENRLRLTIPHVIDRIRFVPYQPVDGYYDLTAAADILLDPIHYGGGLTSFDGLGLGKPIVTLPGEFVRGRYTFGFYRAMGVEDCVATTPEEYVQIAVKLGTNRDWRARVAQEISQRGEAIFEEQASVSEYGRIFERLVEEAERTCK
jgi:protein O-GlcNAc transferase